MADAEIIALQDRVHALEPAFTAVEQDFGGSLDFDAFCDEQGLEPQSLAITFEPKKGGEASRDFVPRTITVESTRNSKIITSTWGAVDASCPISQTTAILEIKNGQLVQEGSDLFLTGSGIENVPANDIDSAVALTEWMQDRMRIIGALNDSFDD